MARKHKIDLTNGPVVKKFVAFTIPILLSALMQQLYHSADMLVVGNFSQNTEVALGAVGASTHIITLILNFFVGITTGANIVCANYIGAGDKEGLARAMRTSIASALIGGLFVSVVGFFAARPMLVLLETPTALIDEAVVYLRIVFLGKISALVFNAAAGILRAHGDSQRPMYISALTGALNVVLNLIFVVLFHWDAAGVAAATAISTTVSAAFVLVILFHPNGEFGLSLFDIRIYLSELKQIVGIGVPAGINSILFSISNLTVTASLNSLGTQAVAGVSAANTLVNLLNTFVGGFSTAFVAFSAQNFGAKKIQRTDEAIFKCISLGCLMLFLFAGIFAIKPEFFVGIFTSDPILAALGAKKLLVNGLSLPLHLIESSLNSTQRGMRHSARATSISLFFTIVPRIIWTMFIFPKLPQTLVFLFLCYPLSWGLAAIGQGVSYYFIRKKTLAELALEEKEA